MGQLRLFPPPGSIPKPLPKDALDAARELIVEMLAMVLAGDRNEQHTSDEGKKDE